jgi:hypothetical protein
MSSRLNTVLIGALVFLVCPLGFPFPAHTQVVAAMEITTTHSNGSSTVRNSQDSAEKKASVSSPATLGVSLRQSDFEKPTLNELLTLLLSFLAFVVSLYALKISRDSRDLAIHSYSDDRRVLLRTEEKIGASGPQGITFRTLEGTAQVNNLSICFPSVLEIPALSLMPPDLTLYASRVVPAFREYLCRRLGSPSLDTATVIPRYTIQVLVVVHGYTRGVASVTTAIYDLVFSYVHVPGREPDADIKAAVLNNYIERTDDPQAYIDNLFTAVQKAIDTNIQAGLD